MILLEIDALEIIVDFFKFIVPSLIVFGVTYFLLSKFLEEQRLHRILELKKGQSAQITPIRLQAYERLALFLDRISPDNLVIRMSRSGQSADQLRQELVQTITNEYNHNISQQIYISDDAWKMIIAVKEQIIQVIEICYKDCSPEESGPGLGKKILKKLMNEKEIPTQRAIELLKKEIEIAL